MLFNLRITFPRYLLFIFLLIMLCYLGVSKNPTHLMNLSNPMVYERVSQAMWSVAGHCNNKMPGIGQWTVWELLDP